jgi:hypothetical protein
MVFHQSDIEDVTEQKQRNAAKPKEEEKKGGRGMAFPKELKKLEALQDRIIDNNSFINPKDKKLLAQQMELVNQSSRIADDAVWDLLKSFRGMFFEVFGSDGVATVQRVIRKLPIDGADEAVNARNRKIQAFFRDCGWKI